MLYNFEEVRLTDLLEDIVVFAQQLSPSHQILVEDLKDIQDVTIQGDRNRLEQVLGNLISNAIKYSPTGSRIIINAESSATEVKIAITDFGIGISPENQEKVFHRYFRAEGKNFNFSGLGIGLYISAEIVRAHSGNLEVKSEPGKGSTFVLTLPQLRNE
ncbi:sensor histidine kinase [Desertivirga arenae]|uniref:sensor histidine kinase n=1 Tax=Desertivirga arenae TaxID=2810309 RepID=UPI001A970FDA|nr:ATP-binding protein [Pedobacter sp. SYSU D00823]